jgi:hypothetical protein
MEKTFDKQKGKEGSESRDFDRSAKSSTRFVKRLGKPELKSLVCYD